MRHIDEQGSVIIFGILVIIMIAIITATLSSITISNISISHGNEHSHQAYYAAQAAIEYGIFLADTLNLNAVNKTMWLDLDDNGATTGDLPPLAFGTIDSLAITLDGVNNFIINATATARGRTRSIGVTMSSDMTLLSWN